MKTFDADLLAGPFADAFTGTVIAPSDTAYDAARAVWNGTVDARPALIAQCQTTDDIVAAGPRGVRRRVVHTARSVEARA